MYTFAMHSMQPFCRKRASDTLMPQVGVLVNNAGMITPHRWDQQTWDDIMAVNYTGAISLAEQILPVLAEGAPACSMLCVMVDSCYHFGAFQKLECSQLPGVEYVGPLCWSWVNQPLPDCMQAGAS